VVPPEEGQVACRQIEHTMGVMTPRQGQIRQVCIEALLTFRTVMLRIRDHEIPRTPHGEIPQVVQRPMELLVPIGLVTTTQTRLSRVGATERDDLWRWQVCNRGHPFGGIGSIRTRTEYGFVLRARMLGPELYDKGPSGAIPKLGKDAIVSDFT
jgi:hypothetical protein